jgi:site-specific recombinase XerD
MARWKVLDPAVLRTIHASIAASTLKRYSGIFSLFENFLSESDVGRSVHMAETEDVLSFIQDYVDDRKAESTIRSVYSAILFHFRLCGRQEFLLNNPIIQMFVRGAQRLARRPLPRKV